MIHAQGPSAEITLWRDRNANYSALYEQLQTEKVKTMLTAMKKAKTPALAAFEAKCQVSASARIVDHCIRLC